jgi:hypothetical protein
MPWSWRPLRSMICPRPSRRIDRARQRRAAGFRLRVDINSIQRCAGALCAPARVVPAALRRWPPLGRPDGSAAASLRQDIDPLATCRRIAAEGKGDVAAGGRERGQLCGMHTQAGVPARCLATQAPVQLQRESLFSWAARHPRRPGQRRRSPAPPRGHRALRLFTEEVALRRFLSTKLPACLSFHPPAALRKGLHSATMRPFPRLAGRRKSCAIW